MTTSHENLHREKIIENRDKFRIIWLDANNDHSVDSIKTKDNLLELNDAALFYTDSNECLYTIKSIPNERILLIMSGSFAPTFLPQIHPEQSIVAIFIFCADQQQYQSLTTDYKKVVDVVTDQSSLFQLIRQKIDQLEEQIVEFTLFDSKQNSSRILTKESAAFLWHQLLFHVLEQIPPNQQSKEELLQQWEKSSRFNQEELRKIEKFRMMYAREKAIEWYTEECLLYRLLNRALRTENFQLIYSFRFFIIDLSFEIKQKHSKSSNNELFTIYRGQSIPTEEWKRWENHIGNIISINSFFSTSRDINVSLGFARRSISSDDFLPVLFEIEVNPSVRSIVYADITNRTHHSDEQEILFNLNSVFKIISINFDPIHNIRKIKLQTTDEGTRNVEEYLQYIQQEINECSPTVYLGWLLLDELGQTDRAEEYFRMLLKTMSADHPDYASVYNGIGRVYSQRNQLLLALENYQLALKIRQEKLPENHLRIAASLHNIGNILKEKEDFDEALGYFEKAQKIEESHHSGDSLQKAIIIQNIGNTWTEKNDAETALKHLYRAYDMLQRILPEKHPTISTCLGDIGFVYQQKCDWNRALDYYYQALKIDECYLPSDHPQLIKDLQHIAFTYKENGEIGKAYDFCSEKLVQLKKTSGNNHTRIAQILVITANVIEKEHRLRALGLYEKALLYLEKSRPIDQRVIARCLEFIGNFYRIDTQFDQAFPKLLKALIFYRQVWTCEHIDIAHICETIGHLYQETNKPLEALDYFKESLANYRANYGSNHTKVKSIEKYISLLNRDPLTSTNIIEAVEENINNEQQTTTVSFEPVTENISDEQLVTIIIDDKVPVSIVEPSPLPATDPALTSPPLPTEINSETKTLGKRKLCPRCEIL